jgi:hypothetical protein
MHFALHPETMGIRNYFKGARLAKMSSGTYCIIRDLGLVKGGKGLKHHENLLTLTFMGMFAKCFETFRTAGTPSKLPAFDLQSRPRNS